MIYESALSILPDTDKKVIAILSGGLDSSVLTMLLVEAYGAENVSALSFDYGQKQKAELKKAAELCRALRINHKVLDLSILGDIARSFSSNIAGSDITTPTIAEVIGDPQPSTYVPNRNMIMYSIAAAEAEVQGAEYIFCGLQVHDLYSYWDVSQTWVDSMNTVLSQNRKANVKIVSPFSQLSKYDEILITQAMNKEDLLQYTLTCYNPNDKDESCGECPSCSERIANFGKVGIPDPVPYAKELNWEKIIQRFKE